ncbi:MAG: hypothetical protein FWF68_07795 [Spirochaetes bacterium]|nr:hypothetical protein [Spirochaetota bacterium]
MKVKHLIIVFNSIIVVIILFIALMPSFLAGPEFWAVIQLKILPFFLFIILLLVSMNIFFYVNYRLLSLLEREDWSALSFYLEHEIYTKGEYSSRKVRLLASSYLVISDYASVLKLESNVMRVKPSIIDKNILTFGSARLLSGSHEEAAAFFKAYIDKGRVKDMQWVRWFYGFSQLLCGVFDPAEQEFSSLAISSDNALITGLSSYFLQSSIAKNSRNPEECLTIAENGRKRALKFIGSIGKWQSEADVMQTEVYISIIRNYINQAGKWLYNSQE